MSTWPGPCSTGSTRAVNVGCAEQMGIPAIQFHDADQLKDDLERQGVSRPDRKE